MSARVRAHDWAATPLGLPSSWPAPLRTLVDVLLAAGQPMFLSWGPERILLYNDSYVPLLGSKHPNALGRPFFDVWPEVRGDIAPLFERVFSGEPIHMDEISLLVDRHGTPEEAHFAFSYTPVRTDLGNVAGLFCACSEITGTVMAGRRRAFRLALEQRLRDLAEPRSVMAAAAEMLGRRLDVSRVGYAEVEADDAHFVIAGEWDGTRHAAVPGRFRIADFGTALEADYRAGRIVSVEDTRLDLRVAGREVARHYAAVGIRALLAVPLVKDGRLAAMLFAHAKAPRSWPEQEATLVLEVAERTWSAVARARAEASLRDLASSLEVQVERRTAERDRVWRNSRDLLVVVGGDGVFRAASPAWTAILGHQPDEVVGRSYRDFIHPDDVQSTGVALDDAVASRDLTAFENRYCHKDGGYRWISWNSSFEDGVAYGYGRDVTAEKEQADALRHAEELLRQSQKMEAVGQLTGGLAHDFNNLLTGITGSLELLQARVAQGRVNDLDRYLLAAQGASKRAAALTHRLLAFSRQQTLEPKVVDVNRLVAGMEELIRRTAGPSIEVEVVGAAGAWTVMADHNQLENALLNLCINARDAMPAGGRLTIETANKWLDDRAAKERELPPGQYLSLCVSDTGTGMTQEVIRRAFDPFYTTKPIGMGTGLGLSMIYGFVKQSGGQARIYSEPGQGAMVCLYLPRHLGSGGPVAEAESAAAAVQGTLGGSVLVVDDEPTVRMLVTEILEDLGYAAIEAEDAAAGLRVLRSGARVDLLVSDVGLPGGMNGRQLADVARVLRPDLKVLFITGYAENAVLGHGHLDPGMRVMTKPFAMDALAARIRAMIEEDCEV